MTEKITCQIIAAFINRMYSCHLHSQHHILSGALVGSRAADNTLGQRFLLENTCTTSCLLESYLKLTGSHNTHQGSHIKVVNITNVKLLTYSIEWVLLAFPVVDSGFQVKPPA